MPNLVATREPIRVKRLEVFISHLFNFCPFIPLLSSFCRNNSAELRCSKAESLVQIEVCVFLKLFFFHLVENWFDVGWLHLLDTLDRLINKYWKGVVETIPGKGHSSSRSHREVKPGALGAVEEFSKELLQACLPDVRKCHSQRFAPEITFCSVAYNIDEAFRLVELLIFFIPKFSIIPRFYELRFVCKRFLWWEQIKFGGQKLVHGG